MHLCITLLQFGCAYIIQHGLSSMTLLDTLLYFTEPMIIVLTDLTTQINHREMLARNHYFGVPVSSRAPRT